MKCNRYKIHDLKLEDVRLYIVIELHESDVPPEGAYDKYYEGNKKMASDFYLIIHDDYNGKTYACRIIYGENGNYINIPTGKYYLKEGDAEKIYMVRCAGCGEFFHAHELSVSGGDLLCDDC